MLFVTNLHFKHDGNGGQQRTYFLVKELARHFDLFVISPYKTGDAAMKGVEATFIESHGVRARKKMQTTFLGRAHAKFLQQVFRFSGSIEPPVSYRASQLLQKQLKSFKRQKQFDHVRTIVFDTIRTVGKFDKALFQSSILNAHNFDYEVYEYELQQLNEGTSSAATIQDKQNDLLYAKKFEFDIDSYFDVIWTCSETDIEKFKTHNPNTKVVFESLPNGSDTETRTVQKTTNNYKKLLFVGSLNYFPNVNGLKWFVNAIFNKLPSDFEFNIIGKSPNSEAFKFLESYDTINLIGEVDDVEPYYASHDVVMVPLFEGSGTRLKILEAFSYGKLVLSTPKGIEGIEANDGEHYLEFDNFEEFESKFLKAMDTEQFGQIRKNARQLVEDKYSWKQIVARYIEENYGN